MKLKGAYSLEGVMTNLHSILKSRDITLPTKVGLIKAMVCPVVMHGCESWTSKKAGRKELMLLNCGVWKDSRESPWTARRSNQSILKKISSGYSLEGLMLRLKLQVLWPLDGRTDSLEKTLMPGKIEGRTEDEMVGWHHWLNGHEFEQAPGIGDGQGSLACYSPWGCKESDMPEQLNWNKYKAI